MGLLPRWHQYRPRYSLQFPFTSKGAVIRKSLLALSVLAALAGGTVAALADAAPLAYDLLSSVEALLPAANAATDDVLNDGAAVLNGAVPSPL